MGILANMKTLAITGLLLLAGAFGQTAPRTWHFTCDYYNFSVKGQLSGRQRYSASYTRGLPGDVVRWSDITVANAGGWSGDFGPAQKQAFMEGFSYPHADVANMTKPDFFRGFPPLAMQQRNLAWDTHMLEGFVADFDHLKLNIPYHVPEAAEVDLAGAGTFRHKDLQLILTGNSKRHGQECAVIDYRALFNTLEAKTAAFALTGRSDYWGQIWMSLATRQIEYATLYEEVLGELTMPGQEKPMTLSVVRVGVFEPAER
jgi:hypothetical protein